MPIPTKEIALTPQSRIVRIFAAALLCLVPACSLPAAAGGGERDGAQKGVSTSPADKPRTAPVEWMDWGPAAFHRAQTTGRPILLNVVVSWSRQCSEMEKTWSDPKVASLIAENFVPVKVDADRRPDIRERYPGPSWPSVTLVVPDDGSPFFFSGSESRTGPARVRFGLLPPEKVRSILEESLLYYRGKRASLKKAVEDGLKAEEEPRTEPVRLEGGALTRLTDKLRANFDSLNGGWTRAPKFYMSGPVEALLFAYSRDGSAASLETARRALTAVTDGPAFDRVEGGMHRLSLDETWKRPEYEKLLDRNVTLLDDLLTAALLTSDRAFGDPAALIVRYLENTLRRTGGGHYASQSFDPSSPDGGDYYRATAAERAKKRAPAVDRLVPLAWSAKAAAAELRASSLLNRPDLEGPGRETLDWLLGTFYRKGRGVPHAVEGETVNTLVYFEDQVLFVEAMVDAFQAGGDRRYLDAANDTAHFAARNLFDEQAGLFGDIIPDPGGPRPLRRALHPFEANCRMARMLARLYYLDVTQREFQKIASSILTRLAGRYENAGPAGSYYGVAATEYLEGPLWVWVVGTSEVPGYRELLVQANRIPVFWKLVRSLHPVNDGASISRLGFVQVAPPALYLSKGAQTSRPAPFPDLVQKLYGDFRKVIERAPAGAAEPPGQAAPPGPARRDAAPSPGGGAHD